MTNKRMRLCGDLSRRRALYTVDVNDFLGIGNLTVVPVAVDDPGRP